MKPENILKTDLLDILFENKNKNYGAYNLRKFYNNRLKKSLGITTLLVLVFAGLQSWKTPKRTVTFEFGPTTEIILEKHIDASKPKEAAKPKQKHEMNVVKFITPVIVPKALVNPTPTVTEIDTSVIGFKNNLNGGRDSGLVGVEPGKPDDKGVPKGNVDAIPNTDDTEIILNPSIMPEFNGGLEALKAFMLRNLSQPDDIELGEKIVVIVKFVVDKNGNIDNAEIVQSGREDLDSEVLRVINKMPSWKPGLQNGYPVAAYFKMPITFVNNN